MTFRLSSETVEHFYAWVTVSGGDHQYLAAYYKGTDGHLHWEYRIASGSGGMERKKTFVHNRKPLPSEEDIREEAKSSIVLVGRSMLGDASEEPIGALVWIDGSLDRALDVLQEMPGVTTYPVH